MNYLYLTIVFPLIGFLLLAFGRDRWSENVAAVIGVGALGLAAATTAWVGFDFLSNTPESGVFTLPLWTWVAVPGFAPRFDLHLDGGKAATLWRGQ